MARLPDLREIRASAVAVLLAGLGVNAAAFFLVNQPLAVRLRNADTEVRALMEEVDQRRDHLAEFTVARDRLSRHVRDMELFFDEVLSGQAERMVAVQREIREIALRHKVNPESIGYSHSVAQEGTDFIRFSASFPLLANYQSLRAFIRDIEHSSNFLVIDSVDLTSSKEGGVMLSLSISVSTVFRDPDYLMLREKGQG